MMIREKLNKHSKAITAVVIVISVAAVGAAWTQYRATNNHHFAPGPNYYTTDDSSPAAALAAMFKDDATKMPPFDHNGKPAVRAYVFTADGGRTKWVGYLERLTEKGVQQMADINAGKFGNDPAKIAQLEDGIMKSETEIKRPGDADWVREREDNPDVDRVQKLTPPDGQSLANVQSVFP